MSRIDELKELKDQSVDYMCDEIKHIIGTFDKRDPGSDGERAAQKYMEEVLKPLSDETTFEDFKLNPGSFFGWIPITMSFLMASLVVYFFAPLVALVLLIIAIIPMISQFVLYKKLMDPLFKEKTSCNVTAVKKPTGEVKRRIFLNGHADATWEWTINYHFGGKAFSGHFLCSIVGVFFYFAIVIAALVMNGVGFNIASDVTLWLGVASLAFLPFWIGMFFFSNSKVVVDGANDNLTGCYLPISILKGLKDLGIELENTEVGVIISGSEEAGLRGAKAWAEAHKGEYQDVPTFIVSYDTIHELECLNINDKDLNGLVTVDKDVCELLMEASDNTGAGATYATVTVGATDPAAFVQGGFKSACITALNHSLQPYYHTRKDTVDLLDKECLGVVYDMTVEALKLFDSGKYDGVNINVVKAKGIRKEYKNKKKA
ncbi:MAG: M28 family peptidase [Clostridiaceae bacterium]|jgi:hypothetical protein|nr:M28 family peptidase [Clostridiaceae bacterium]